MQTAMCDRIRRSDEGFSLIETLVAMGILATGLLTLAGVFVVGMRSLAASSPGLIAREKAREAIESVHTARDTRVIGWDQIANAPGGVFLTGERSVTMPGPDGLVNTADDGAVEEMKNPGKDGVLGTVDDIITPLKGYTREIQITSMTDANGAVDLNLRQVRVIVRYLVAGAWRSYTLTTYISSFA
jgi:prepilin-type N-terminal cleavage/methylation domain-containing protein